MFTGLCFKSVFAIKIWFFANNFFHRRGTPTPPPPPHIPSKPKEGVVAHLLMVWLFQKKLKIMCHFVPKFEKVPILVPLAYISAHVYGTLAFLRYINVFNMQSIRNWPPKEKLTPKRETEPPTLTDCSFLLKTAYNALIYIDAFHSRWDLLLRKSDYF